MSFYKVRFGDYLSFYVDDYGYLSIPSFDTPLEESFLKKSHLKAAKGREDNADSIPEDFQTRCVFQVLSEKGQAPEEDLLYGSIIKLVHFKTGYTVTASQISSRQSNENFCTRLSKRPISESIPASQFYVLPRYSMRKEGDVVHTNDRVVLESVLYKGLYLTSTDDLVHHKDPNGDLDIMSQRNGFVKKGFKVQRVRRYVSPGERKDGGGEDEDENAASVEYLYGGDFITLFHVEGDGNLICRVDDEWERSIITGNMGLGVVCRKLRHDKDHSVGCFVRCDGTSGKSPLSIWQVLHADVVNGEVIEWDSQVRFRHVATGQYLCLRLLDPDRDTQVLRSSATPVEDLAKKNAEVRKEHSKHRCEGHFLLATSSGWQDDSTRFTMKPVSSKQSNKVPYMSSMLIEHCQHGLYFMMNSNAMAAHLQPDGTPKAKSGRNGQKSPFQSPYHVGNDLEEAREPSLRAIATDQTEKNDAYFCYQDDATLSPTADDIQGEVYKVLKPSHALVMDLLYILRGQPLLFSALKSLQEIKFDQLPPLEPLAHLQNALHVMVDWLKGRLHHDSSLDIGRCSTTEALTRDMKRNYSDDDQAIPFKEWHLEVRKTNMDFGNLSAILSDHNSKHRGSVNPDDREEERRKTGGGASSLRFSDKQYSVRNTAEMLKAVESMDQTKRQESLVVNQSVLKSIVRGERDRQDMLGTLNYIEFLLQICETSYVIYHLKKRYNEDKAQEDEEKQDHDLRTKWRLFGHATDHVCSTIYELITTLVKGNEMIANTILCLSGMSYMLKHLSIGWEPPIKAVLVAVGSHMQLHDGRKPSVAGGGAPKAADKTKSLTVAEVYQFVRQLHAAREADDPTCLDLLQFLSTLCLSSAGPNLEMQRLICRLLIPPSESGAGTVSLLFSTSQQLMQLGNPPPSTAPNESLRSLNILGIKKTSFRKMKPKPSFALERSLGKHALLAERPSNTLKVGVPNTEVVVVQASDSNDGLLEAAEDQDVKKQNKSHRRNESKDSVASNRRSETSTASKQSGKHKRSVSDFMTNLVSPEKQSFHSEGPLSEEGLGWHISTDPICEKPVYTYSPEEIEQMHKAEDILLEQCFHIYDADGSGSIDLDELRQLLSDMNVVDQIVSERLRDFTQEATLDDLRKWWGGNRDLVNIGMEVDQDLAQALGWDEPPAASPTENDAADRGRAFSLLDYGADKPAAPVGVAEEKTEDKLDPANITEPEEEKPKRFAGLLSKFKDKAGGKKEKRNSSVIPSGGFDVRENEENPQDAESVMEAPRFDSLNSAGDLAQYLEEEQDRWAPFIDFLIGLQDNDDHPEGTWIEASLNILTNFCVGKNFECQQVVSRLMPVDLILTVLLSPDIGLYYKSLFVSLLKFLYVEHDFVFAIEELHPSDTSILSPSTEAVSTGEDGKLFNLLTHKMPLWDEVQGVKQRRKLAKFIEESMPLVLINTKECTKKAPEQINFSIALLSLIKSLIEKGFFLEDLEPGGLTKLMKEVTWGVAQMVTQRQSPQEGGQGPVPDRLERTVVAALVEEHAGRHFLEDDSPEALQRHFSNLFGNVDCQLAKEQALDILEGVQGIRLMNRAKEVLNLYVEAYKARADDNQGEVRLTIQDVPQLMNRIFAPLCEDGELLGLYTHALLGCSIHNDPGMAFEAYTLLFNNIEPIWASIKICLSAKVFNSGHAAVGKRLQSRWFKLFESFSHSFGQDEMLHSQKTLLMILSGMDTAFLQDWAIKDDMRSYSVFSRLADDLKVEERHTKWPLTSIERIELQGREADPDSFRSVLRFLRKNLRSIDPSALADRFSGLELEILDSCFFYLYHGAVASKEVQGMVNGFANFVKSFRHVLHSAHHLFIELVNESEEVGKLLSLEDLKEYGDQMVTSWHARTQLQALRALRAAMKASNRNRDEWDPFSDGDPEVAEAIGDVLMGALAHPTITAVFLMEATTKKVAEQCCVEIFRLYTDFLANYAAPKPKSTRSDGDMEESGKGGLDQPARAVPAPFEEVLPFPKLVELMGEHAGAIPTPYNEFYLSLFEVYTLQNSHDINRNGAGTADSMLTKSDVETGVDQKEEELLLEGVFSLKATTEDPRSTLQLSQEMIESLPTVARVVMTSLEKIHTDIQTTGGLMKLEGAWNLISRSVAPFLWQLSGYLTDQGWRLNHLELPSQADRLIPLELYDPAAQARRHSFRSRLRNCGACGACLATRATMCCLKIKGAMRNTESAWELGSKVDQNASITELYVLTITMMAQLLVWDDDFRDAILNYKGQSVAHNQLYEVVVQSLDDALAFVSSSGSGFNATNSAVMRSWATEAKEELLRDILYPRGAAVSFSGDAGNRGLPPSSPSRRASLKARIFEGRFHKAFHLLFEDIDSTLQEVASGVIQEEIDAGHEDPRDSFGREGSVLRSFIRIPSYHSPEESLNSEVGTWMGKRMADNLKDLEKLLETYITNYQQIAESQRFVVSPKWSDFDVFTEGGGVILKSLLRYLPIYCKINYHTAMFYVGLLRNCLKKKVQLVHKKRSNTHSESLKRCQISLNSLGGMGAVMKILKEACNHLYDPQASTKIVPLLLEFGSSLVDRNAAVQNTIIKGLHGEEDQGSLSLVSDQHITEFLLGLQHVFRFLRLRIEASTTTESTLAMGEKVLFRALYTFLNAMVSGNNKLTKSFLREQPKMPESVNLIVDAAIGVQVLAVLICSKMKYIEDPEFFKAVTMPIPGSGGRNRRFIDWTDQGPQLFALQSLFPVLTCGLATLTELIQGPIFDNQLIVRRALVNVEDLLEFAGIMSLHITRWKGLHKEVWEGGNPQHFYLMLLMHILPKKELANSMFLQKVERACIEWGLNNKKLEQAAKHAKKTTGCAKFCSLLKERCWDVRSCCACGPRCRSACCASDQTSKQICRKLGFDLVTLKEEAHSAEQQLLMLLSAMLEGQNQLLVEHVMDHIDWPVMMQNMGSSFLLSKHDESFRQIAVLYLTVLSSLSTATNAQSSQDIAKWLDKYDVEMAAEGIHKEDVISSVEVVGGDGQVTQVFFPVPDLVKLYWEFPKVRKLKERIKFQVNRESPEEKILDFYKKMDSLYYMLRMQRTLRHLFGPFHVLFGGKTYIPILGDQRKMILFLTLVLNFTMISEGYFKDRTYLSDKVYLLDQYESWEEQETFHSAAKYLHTFFCSSLCMAELLNSVAAFDVLQKMKEESFLAKIHRISWLRKPLTIFIILKDKAWFLALLTLSLLGQLRSNYWYGVCILDIIPQIRMMEFLLESISRNLWKLFLTVLLGIILLYNISLVTYLFYQNMYDLDGHMECDTLLTCFKLHVDYGLLNPPSWQDDGAISTFNHGGVAYEYETLYHFLYEIASSSYNLIYVILINLVLSAIISGLIIDTFSEMRDENEATLQDILDKCFICSIERDDFDQLGASFNKHVQQEHNMWKYLQLKIYLDRKDEFSYTGTEHYLYQGFKKAETFVRLIPIKKALAFERAKGGIKEKNDIATLSLKLRTIEAKQDKSTKNFQLCLDKVCSLVDSNRDLVDMVKSEKSNIQQLATRQTDILSHINEMKEEIKKVQSHAVAKKSKFS